MNDKLQGERELPELVVTRNGKVCEDQAAALAEFKQACIDAGQDGDAQPQAPKVPDTAEPVATIVTDRYGVYVKDLRWLKKLDLPDGDYPLYLAPPSTAQAVEAAIRKAANHLRNFADDCHTCNPTPDDLREVAKEFEALIPTEAAQVEPKPVKSGTWSLEENVKALLSNPVSAIACFGYEWLTTVVRELAAQGERDAKGAERLDFLSRVLFEHKWSGTIGDAYRWNLAGNFRHTMTEFRGNTFREAIDAAMDSAKREG